MFPSQTADKFMLRMPDGMRNEIRDRAEANRRSMNAEIVHILDRALITEEAKGPAATAIAPSQEHDHSR